MVSNELSQAQEAFAQHFANQAEEAVRQLEGPDYQSAAAFLRRERENCMEALRVLFDVNRAAGLRLMVAVAKLARDFQASLDQWLDWMERYHDACADMPPSQFTARLAQQLGWARWYKSASNAMSPEVGQCWEEAVRLAGACGDLATLGEAQVCRAMAGDDLPTETRASLEREGIANARASGDLAALTDALVIVATGSPWTGFDFPSRKKQMEEALAIVERLGRRQPLYAATVNAMGRMYRHENMHAEAEPWFIRAHEMARSMKRAPLHFGFDLPGHYLFDTRQPEKARPVLKEAMESAIGFGAPKFLCDGLVNYAMLAFIEGKYERGAKLYAAWMAQVSPGKQPPPEHLALMDEAAKLAVPEAWSVGQAMSLDEAVALAKEDW